MYVSPIEKIYGDIQTEIIRRDEENLMMNVTQATGYKVDKDELLKLLQFDRQQYEKGYEDGYKAAEEKFKNAIEELFGVSFDERFNKEAKNEI